MDTTKIIAVLFDFDGVIMDTETQYTVFYLSRQHTDFLRSESRHAPIRTQLYASDSAGNSDHLYDDRFEQCDACYRISEEGDAYFDGNGSSQYHPRSHLYISF